MRRQSIGVRAVSYAGILAGLFLLHFNLFAQPERTVTLTGNRHPLARPEFEIGPAAPDFPMQRMILVLNPSSDQGAALEALAGELHDPASPEFHRWLTPEDFAARFGVNDSDLQRVTEWLAGEGFTIDEIPAGRRSIIFSGTAAQVEAAFQTPIRVYRVGGELHHANAADPQIPESLGGVVAGAVSLHDFRRAPLHSRIQSLPEYSSGGAHYLAPADFATIYDVAAVYTSGFTGSGQSIAIAGRTNIRVSDVQAFRAMFQLPLNNPTVIVNGADPGIVSTDEETEADLDVEWSGAVAPMAAVKFVVSASTSSTDGVDLSAQYIVNHNLAPVLSVSFGSCEAQMGAAERSFYNSLWQQAAAQGITALISAGDSGAAGCDSPSETTATLGQAINGLCSTPYSVCVGGTEFYENGNNNLYWSASNNASLGSALSYIPEVAWNESGSNGGSDLWATGGGASLYYSKPSWQTGPGVPSDSKRDVPDIALSSAVHDGYLVNILGSYYIVGGTSAASPSFAGVMALVNQKTGARQGNINTILYPLAALAASGGAPVFHTVTGGNNTVPGVTGFTAGAHYNQATGLGSPDALLLVNHWSNATVPANPAFSLSPLTAASVIIGGHAAVSVAVAISGGFNAAVALSITGVPAGVTGSFTPATLAAPGSGASTLNVSAAASTVAGAYPVTVVATSGSQQKTAAFTLTIVPPFTVSASPSTISLARGGSGPVTITTTAASGFSGALTLSAPKLPTGVTAAFAPATIAAPGTGSSRLTLSAAATATPGTYTIAISAGSGSTLESASVSLTIAAPATFTLNAAPPTVTVAPGASGSTLVSLTPLNGFNGVVNVSYGVLPAGVTAHWTTAAAGATLVFQVSSSAALGSHAITITGSNATVTPSPTAVVTLNIARSTPSGR